MFFYGPYFTGIVIYFLSIVSDTSYIVILTTVHVSFQNFTSLTLRLPKRYHSWCQTDANTLIYGSGPCLKGAWNDLKTFD